MTNEQKHTPTPDSQLGDFGILREMLSELDPRSFKEGCDLLALIKAERDRLREVNGELIQALKRIDQLEGTEHNEWDAVERVITTMCEIAREVLAKHSAHGQEKGG